MNLFRYSELEDQQLIYHYCSPHTFLLICTNKTVRFSDILTMNDSLEMQWGYRLWERIASEQADVDVLFRKLKDDVDERLSATVPLVSCFANQGDILSQWRAYADDGTGFAIGFNRNLTYAFPASLLHVSYSPDEQESEIRELASRLVKAVDTDRYDDLIFAFIGNLIGYKNPAFVEEGEVRLIHVANRDEQRVLRSIGGHVNEKPVPPATLHFQMRNSTPSPYIDLSFGEASEPISEVIMGPKNHADPERIKDFLSTVGFKTVAVNRSVASYR